MGTAKAVGVDGLPAEFITKATSDETGNVWLAVLLALLNAVLSTGVVPDEWKGKAMSMLHKKGDVTNPANYRALAVSTTMYRIFTSVLAARLSAYLDEHDHILADIQFAFRRGLSTEHAHVVIATCIEAALARRVPLAVVQLDVAKAFDTVDRDKLWVALSEEGIPGQFVQLLQELYRNTPYILRINGVLAEPFISAHGVMQGCSLSPMQYNLYLVDCLQRIEARCLSMGLSLGTAAEPYSQLLAVFADDIKGFVQLQHLGAFLDIVEEELGRRDQRLNRDKCKVMVVGRAANPAQQLCGVPVEHSLKILGVHFAFDGRMGPNVDERAQQGLTKVVLHNARLQRFGCSKDLLLSNLMLHQDVKQTLLFGAAAWGHHGLSTSPMCHVMQKPYSIMQRSALGQPCSTAHWIASMVSGNWPIQHFIILTFCKVWNRVLAASHSNPLIAASLQTQQSLLRSRKKCWLKHWYNVLRRLLPDIGVHDRLHDLLDIDTTSVENALAASYNAALLGMGDALHPACRHRRIAMATLLLPDTEWGRVPRQVKWSLPAASKQLWLHFLCANSALPVHDYDLCRGHFTSRVCPKCRLNQVGDEAHALL